MKLYGKNDWSMLFDALWLLLFKNLTLFDILNCKQLVASILGGAENIVQFKNVIVKYKKGRNTKATLFCETNLCIQVNLKPSLTHRKIFLRSAKSPTRRIGNVRSHIKFWHRSTTFLTLIVHQMRRRQNNFQKMSFCSKIFSVSIEKKSL